MQWKLLIFDWDGTLMDSAARIVACMREASLHYGLIDQHDDAYKNVIGLGLREALRALHPAPADSVIEQVAAEYRLRYLQTNDTPSALFTGATEVLQTLAADGYWLAIATGKGREGLNQVLQQTGLQKRFHVTRCASETRSKPHPQMLEEILEHLGLQPVDALMIGDTEYDMDMARNIGMAALAVSYGVHSVERLMKHQPIDCLHDIAQLPELLQQLASKK